MVKAMAGGVLREQSLCVSCPDFEGILWEGAGGVPAREIMTHLYMCTGPGG